MDTLRRRTAHLLTAVATALAIVALVLPLFLNPAWVAFEQGRSQATAWTGFSDPQLRAATDAILADLVVGPADFDVAVDGVPVLNTREQSHMRDVRTVFIGFFVIAAVLAATALVVAARRRSPAGAQTWRAMRAGAVGLIVGLVAVGAIAFVAFDVLFELFHRLLFPGGTYTFDPTTERLVQLFPFQFWQETAIAVGAAAAVVATLVALVAHRRSRRGAQRTATPTPVVSIPVRGRTG